MEVLWSFFAGLFLWNSVPHLIKGITGQAHMTPFKRESSPVLNVLWSFANLAIAFFFLGLASGTGGLVLPWESKLTGSNLWAFLAGGLAIAVSLAAFWSNPNARLPWHRD